MAGMAISLTAVQEWLGDEELRKTVTEEVLSGKKYGQPVSQPTALADRLQENVSCRHRGFCWFRRSWHSHNCRAHRGRTAFPRFRNKEVDHQRRVLRLLCHRCQDGERLLCPPHSAQRSGGDQTYQDVLLDSCRNYLYPIREGEGACQELTRQGRPGLPGRHVELQSCMSAVNGDTNREPILMLSRNAG